MKPETRTLRVKELARVEGAGGLYVSIRGGEVADVHLKIHEPPRFFEALLRGRAFGEAPDLTARICGICPVAYQMSAVRALEEAMGVAVTAPIRDLRRLLYCGEWIESHALHIHLLHAPDFLGYPDALRMARDHPDTVHRGLELKKIGNAIIALLGGREIHPINVRVGGFYRLPARRDLLALRDRVQRARDLAMETARWAGTLPCPDLEIDTTFVSLSQPDAYPIDAGRIVSDRGLDVPVSAFEDHFAEEQVPHSTALHSSLRGSGPYLVGPLARYALNADRLSEEARAAARSAGLGPVCRNPFRSIVVRAVEVVEACAEALRLIDRYEPPDAPAVAFEPREASGCGATEAPRGLLYHRYRVDREGLIAEAKIVPPTAQNQKSIEDDLRRVVRGNLSLGREELTARCEQTIRNYDPCISCAVHFLNLEVEEG